MRNDYQRKQNCGLYRQVVFIYRLSLKQVSLYISLRASHYFPSFTVGYVSGGFDGRKIYDDVWMLDLTTLQWTKLDTKLPRPVYFHSSAITPVCHTP